MATETDGRKTNVCSNCMRLLNFTSRVTLCRREIGQKGYCKRRYDRFKEEYNAIKVFCNGVPIGDDELLREFRHYQANMRWYRKKLRLPL